VANTTPEHVSYSQLSDWLRCGKYYQLRAILQLPQTPAWWELGGHAVHAATEAYDRQTYTLAGV
jgi:hypothetical protein